MARNGFTLVELLVALALFGMLSAAAVSLLGVSLRTQTVWDTREAALGDLRRLGAVLGADLAQATARPTRDETGRQAPAFSGSSTAMLLVRGGWDNPDDAARPSLQKVGWRVEEGRLTRTAFALLDGAAPLASSRFAAGGGATFRYLNAERQWQDDWTPETARQFPVAVELVLTPGDGAPVRQLFLVGAP